MAHLLIQLVLFDFDLAHKLVRIAFRYDLPQAFDHSRLMVLEHLLRALMLLSAGRLPLRREKWRGLLAALASATTPPQSLIFRLLLLLCID